MAVLLSSYDFTAKHDYIATQASITDKKTEDVRTYTIPEPYHVIGGRKYIFHLFDDLTATVEEVDAEEVGGLQLAS